MKNLLKYAILFIIGATVWSCNEDKLDTESIFVDPTIRETDFDRYLYREFTLPYNIEVIYRLRNTEVDLSHQVTPAYIEASKMMTVLMKHLFIDAYSEASPDGIDFIKEVNVRTIHYVGSGAYLPSGGVTLGEAAGGKKITMYTVNSLVEDPDPLNAERLLSVDDGGVFHTIHHEFCHIMNQLKDYPQTFKQITPSSYIGEQWINVRDNKEAYDKGFITPYGMSAYDEDFVEIYSTYVTHSPEAWEARVGEASEEGRELINEKLALIRGYIKNSWGMDMDVIRDVIQLRASEIGDLEYENLK